MRRDERGAARPCWGERRPLLPPAVPGRWGRADGSTFLCLPPKPAMELAQRCGAWPDTYFFSKWSLSQNGRGWKRPLWVIWPTPPCRSRVTQSRLHMTLSRQGLNISREGESTTSLGNLYLSSALSPSHQSAVPSSSPGFNICPPPLLIPKPCSSVPPTLSGHLVSLQKEAT